MSSFGLDFSFYLIHGGKLLINPCDPHMLAYKPLIKLKVKGRKKNSSKNPTFHFFFELGLYFGNKKIHGFVLGDAVFSGLSIFCTIIAKYKDTIGLLLHPLFNNRVSHLFGTKAKLCTQNMLLQIKISHSDLLRWSRPEWGNFSTPQCSHSLQHLQQ